MITACSIFFSVSAAQRPSGQNVAEVKHFSEYLCNDWDTSKKSILNSQPFFPKLQRADGGRCQKLWLWRHPVHQ